jgi:hypothetical protein
MYTIINWKNNIMSEPKALGSLISITNSLPMHNDGSEESKIRDETSFPEKL